MGKWTRNDEIKKCCFYHWWPENCWLISMFGKLWLSTFILFSQLSSRSSEKWQLFRHWKVFQRGKRTTRWDKLWPVTWISPHLSFKLMFMARKQRQWTKKKFRMEKFHSQPLSPHKEHSNHRKKSLFFDKNFPLFSMFVVLSKSRHTKHMRQRLFCYFLIKIDLFQLISWN